MLYDQNFLDSLAEGVRQLAPVWGLSPDTTIALLTISENATFRADDPRRQEPVILRVYRPGYHTREEILSELSWIEALRAEQVVTAPEPLPTNTGERLASFVHGGEIRHVAAFSFLSGVEPSPNENLVEAFRKLGAISANLHAHARRWQRPEGFVRKRWDAETTLGPRAHWGDWREALGLTPEGVRLLARAVARLQEKLAAYGTAPERFGLIHADLRLANLLVEDGRIAVIDFDDCGFGWFVYDFAAAVSFIETDPSLPVLADAWVDGYRTVAPLAKADVAMIPAFVMLRRMMLTAWIAHHTETPTAQEAGLARYTDGTLALAERFLTEG